MSNSSNLSATKLKKDLLAYAASLGFERVGVTSAEPLRKEETFFKTWLAEGRAGEMDYLEREPERRSRPQALLPGAKAVIAMAINYGYPSSGLRPPSPARGEGESRHAAVPSPLAGEGARRADEGFDGRISRYAAGRDYHKVLTKRLDSFVRYVGALAPGSECRTFVDTGPLLERAAAQRAGLGFIGKNTMLITKGLGSWVFLASVITTLDLPQDSPDERSCGECRLCIDACPTEAITAPFQLDPRRCISYLTIESDGPIDESLRGKMGSWIFGCDICQEVCPHNTPRSPSPAALPAVGLALSLGERVEPTERRAEGEGVLPLSEMLSLRTEDDFRQRFAGTSVMRAGRTSLVRNACVAAANLKRRDLLPQLEELSRQDPHPVVRDHAAWALERLR